jgi:hypothetical protein
MPMYAIHQEKLTVDSDFQIKRFLNAYHNIERIQEIEEIAVLEDDELLEHDKDPIIEYVRETYKKKLPPHKIAFKKQRMNPRDVNREEDDYEDIKYDLTGITFSIRFAEAFSVNLKYNNYLDHIILRNNNLNDTSFALLI